MSQLEQLREQLDELRARVEGLVTRIDDQEDRLEDAADASPTSAVVSTEAWTCGSLSEWVEEVFAWHFTRDHQTQAWYWCPLWWDHVEAVSRLTALWHAWEGMHMSASPGAGLAGWYHELDHQLPILMGPNGPFRLCKAGSRHLGTEVALQVEPAPMGGSAPRSVEGTEQGRTRAMSPPFTDDPAAREFNPQALGSVAPRSSSE